MVTRVRGRAGKSSLGCLFTILLVVVVAYFGINIGEVYLRYYRFRDSVQQAARFAPRLTDDDIRARLRDAADSLGLPESAHDVKVRRREHHITITSEYTERVELPGYVREIRFAPRGETTF
ncbi:MAG TPA: hypothetical protein VHM30_01005 [Gemmatimonadaceae bacterium]|nr:hypothetical protein [Gemmatimonadaceae bacterium]